MQYIRLIRLSDLHTCLGYKIAFTIENEKTKGTQ